MEEGQIPLEELVNKFEEGQTLLKNCTIRLKCAELKIEKLKTNTEDTLEPFNE